MMNRLRLVAIAVSTTLLLAGCVNSPIRIGGASGFSIGTGSAAPESTGFNPISAIKALTTTDITPEQELQMGREAAAVLLGAAPLVADQALQRYVNDVGQWIAAQTGRDDIKWHFGVLDSPNVNAFAAPGGYILITRGLLARLNGEAELAGALAHEIAHVLERHHVKGMLSKDRSGAVMGLIGEIAASKSGHAREIGSLTNVAKGLYSSGLDKDDEYQADRIGAVLAVRAGYDPYGLARVLQMYAGNKGAEGFELFFGTHPSAQSRLEALGTILEPAFSAYERTGVSDTKAFSRRVGKLKG